MTSRCSSMRRLQTSRTPSPPPPHPTPSGSPPPSPVILSYQGPFPLIAQFCWAASCRKSPGCSKLLPFKNYGGHCALVNLQYSKNMFVTFPRSVPWHNPSQSSAGSSFDLMAWILLICIITCEAVYWQVSDCLSNHVQSIEFTIGRLQWRCRNISKMIKRNGRHPS